LNNLISSDVVFTKHLSIFEFQVSDLYIPLDGLRLKPALYWDELEGGSIFFIPETNDSNDLNMVQSSNTSLNSLFFMLKKK
jgi:hypothetical protein